MRPLLLLALAASGFCEETGLTPQMRERLAGAVVRSEEWKIDRSRGVEEFIGNVSYKNDGQAFRSDWALWDRKKNLFFTRGRTHATRTTADGEVLEAWSHEGEYDFAADKGKSIAGKEPVRFRRTAPGVPALDGLSRRAEWDGPGKSFSLQKEVKLYTSSETARGEDARWLMEERRLSLEGGPPVLEYRGERFHGALQAKTVELMPDAGQVRATGGVRGWAVQYPQPAGGAP